MHSYTTGSLSNQSRENHQRVARIVWTALILVGLAATACATPTPMPAPTETYTPYEAGAPDQLIITILPEPLILEAALVRPDGMITLQLIGDVRAAGRTLSEIGTDIEERISKFKRGARATVALAAAESSTITVMGEVKRPGTFPLVKDTRIAEALGMSGDLTTFAKSGNIRVVRSTAGAPIVMMVNLKAIRGGDMSTNIQVYGGDVIYVPPTLLARFGYAMNQLLFPFSPFLGIFNSAVGSAIAF